MTGEKVILTGSWWWLLGCALLAFLLGMVTCLIII